MRHKKEKLKLLNVSEWIAYPIHGQLPSGCRCICPAAAQVEVKTRRSLARSLHLESLFTFAPLNISREAAAAAVAKFLSGEQSLIKSAGFCGPRVAEGKIPRPRREAPKSNADDTLVRLSSFIPSFQSSAPVHFTYFPLGLTQFQFYFITKSGHAVVRVERLQFRQKIS